MRAWVCPSGHVEGDGVNDVVVVAGRVLDQLGGLGLADLVGGARHHRLLAGRLRRVLGAEGAESEAADILAQRRCDPGRAAVARHLDRADAVAGVPGDAADGDRSARLQVRALGGLGDQRVHHDLGDRRVDRRLLRGEACHQRKAAERDTIGRTHPEPAFRLGQSRDRGQVLHPVGAGPSRQDEAGGKPVQVRQRHSDHLVGDERRVLDRFPGRDALDEVGGLVADGHVGAVEDDLDRLLLEAGLVQDVLEARALPARAAHGAVAPFHAGNVRLEQPAPVARAHVHRRQLDRRQGLEIVEGELGLAVRPLAADRELPGLGIDLRNTGEMVADEKRVVRRNRGAEIFQRRLVVGRPIAELDQRLLARQRIEHGAVAQALRQARRQLEAPGRDRRRSEPQPRAGEGKAGSGGSDEMATREHDGSSLWRFFLFVTVFAEVYVTRRDAVKRFSPTPDRVNFATPGREMAAGRFRLLSPRPKLVYESVESDEDAMALKAYAAVLGAAVIAVAAVAVSPVEAQTQTQTQVKKKYSNAANRPRARVTVAPRSFLDAGTEVRPGDRKFTDYAFPPSGNGGIGINAVTNTGGKVGWDREPFMQPFQLPGYNPW